MLAVIDRIVNIIGVRFGIRCSNQMFLAACRKKVAEKQQKKRNQATAK